jgi:hypothetical protein
MLPTQISWSGIKQEIIVYWCTPHSLSLSKPDQTSPWQGTTTKPSTVQFGTKMHYCIPLSIPLNVVSRNRNPTGKERNRNQHSY